MMQAKQQAGSAGSTDPIDMEASVGSPARVFAETNRSVNCSTTDVQHTCRINPDFTAYTFYQYVPHKAVAEVPKIGNL